MPAKYLFEAISTYLFGKPCIMTKARVEGFWLASKMVSLCLILSFGFAYL